MHTATHDDLPEVDAPVRREPGEARWVLGDIGGTWSRFSLYGGGQGAAARGRLRNERFASLGDAIRHFCSENHARPDGAALAVAGPLEGMRVAFTNRDWQVDVTTLAGDARVRRVTLVNDFVANAAAVPGLGPADWVAVGQADDRAGVAVVLGPGTGLGAAAVVPDLDAESARAGSFSVLASEAGHMTAASRGPDDDRLIEMARRQWGRVSWERLLCGDGLSWLAIRHGASARGPDAAWVVEDAAGGDRACRQALRQFSALLGAFAGELCLAFRADGGVWLTGGVIDGLRDALDTTAFRAAFRDKGRFADWMDNLPVRRVTAPALAMRGLARIIEGRARVPAVTGSADLRDDLHDEEGA
jgi:glucokinase